MRDSTSEVGVAAVERALAILGAFTTERAGLSLTEIAARTGLYKSTVLRLLTSLERHGYVVRVDGKGYHLGPALLHLGNLYQRSFRLEDHVMPVLRKLARDTEESAAFYVREGNSSLCLFRVDSPQVIRDHVQVGDILPLDRGSTGRTLVAFANGPTGSEKLPIATSGHLSPDAAGLAVPVFGPQNELMGALILTGPKTRFTRATIAVMGAQLLDAAESLTAELGGNVSFRDGLCQGTGARTGARSSSA